MIELAAMAGLRPIGVARSALLAGTIAALPVPANGEFIAFGDSRVEYGVSATLGTSGYSAFTQARSFPAWVGPLSGGRVRLGRYPNFGVAGNDTSQMIAAPRQDASGSPTTAAWYRGAASSANKSLADMQAHPAGIVLFMGGTNDPLRSIDLATTSRVNVETFVAAAAAGKVVLLCNDLPRGINSAGAAQNGGGGQALYDFSRWVLTLDCRSGHLNAKPNVLAVNTYDVIYDFSSGASYLNVRGTLIDGLHLDYAGARMVGQAIADRIAELDLDPDYLDLLPLTNAAVTWVNGNPTMTGAGNGIVGGTFGAAPLASNVPSGWRLDAQSGNTNLFTVTSDKSQLDADGFPRWITTYSATLPAAGGASFKLEQLYANGTAVNALVTGGSLAYTDKLRPIGKLGLSAGSVGLNTLTLIAQYTDVTANKSQRSAALDTQAGQFYALPGVIDGGFPVSMLQAQMIDLQDPNMVAEGRGAVTGSQLYLRWQVGFSNNTGAPLACQATIEVGRTGLRRVAA